MTSFSTSLTSKTEEAYHLILLKGEKPENIELTNGILLSFLIFFILEVENHFEQFSTFPSRKQFGVNGVKNR